MLKISIIKQFVNVTVDFLTITHYESMHQHVLCSSDGDIKAPNVLPGSTHCGCDHHHSR
jgi:hypothetical protein